MKLWTPAVGSVVTAHLPNETIRATVSKIIGRNTIQVILDVQHPLAKSHSFRFKQQVTLHRKPMEPQGTKWEADEEL